MLRYVLYAAEIAMLESSVVVYRFAQDLHFFVTGGDNDNELILATVLQGFFDAVTLLLRFVHQQDLWLSFLLFQGRWSLSFCFMLIWF